MLNKFLYLEREWRDSLYCWKCALNGPSCLASWKITDLFCALLPRGKGAHCPGTVQLHWLTLPDFCNFMLLVSKPCPGGNWREDTGAYSTGLQGLVIWVINFNLLIVFCLKIHAPVSCVWIRERHDWLKQITRNWIYRKGVYSPVKSKN